MLASNAVTVTCTAVGGGLDTDGDGLPDAWESIHGLDPAVPDADADPDGDGLSNEAEWLLGEDPDDPEVRWHVELVPTAAGELSLRFLRKAGVGFEAQSTTNLVSGSWQPIDSPANRPWFSAQDEITSIPVPAERAQVGFFRVRIYPQ